MNNEGAQQPARIRIPVATAAPKITLTVGSFPADPTEALAQIEDFIKSFDKTRGSKEMDKALDAYNLAKKRLDKGACPIRVCDETTDQIMEIFHGKPTIQGKCEFSI